MEWKIEKRNIADLKGYEKNPRKFTKKGLKDLKESLQKCGDANIITINADNTIIGGHARVSVMQQIGIETVDVKVPDHLLNEDEIKEICIRLNANTAGEWDIDKLALNFDVDLLSDWGLDIKLPKLSNEVEEIEIPENARTRVKNNQLWKLGDHYLLCGDATNIEHLKTLMQNKKADLYLTDPPYNVNYEGRTKEKLTIQNDNMSEDNFVEFLSDSFKNANEVLKPGASFYIWHADSQGYEFRKTVKENLGKVRQCLIWNKNQIVMGRQDYQWKHEPCLYGWKDGASHLWASDRKQTTVIDCDKPKKSDLHPTMKPIKLIAQLIENSSKIGAIVLDTFAGSGSTLIACEQLARSCYCLELDTKYCDVILQRWEDLTGKTAELVL